MNRRQFLYWVSGGLAASAQLASESFAGQPNGRMGIADFSLSTRRRAEREGIVPQQLTGPLNYLKYCHANGYGGIQCGIGDPDGGQIKAIGRYLNDHNMFIVASSRLPQNESGLEEFDVEMRTAKQVGANVVRAAFGGRRYEQFEKPAEFQAFYARCLKSLQLTEPIVAKHNLRVAIENHKDWRVSHMLGLIKKLNSEYIGVCVDTGNSFALLEDPMDIAKAYAPYAHCVHLKDMALGEYEDGFLLADVPLGEGLHDMPGIVKVLRDANPKLLFTLEMSTRDPLKVPCLTDRYWATMGDVPAIDLARAMSYVRAHATDADALRLVNHLSTTEKLKVEDEDNRRCLAYARKHLNL